jgi:hypothetical protein
MKASPGKRIGVLLLALALSLGVGLPFVQDGMMAAEMAASTEADHPESQGCGDHGDAAVDACLSMCAAACQCVLPEEPVALAADGETEFRIARVILGGLSSGTDHGPPKHLALG